MGQIAFIYSLRIYISQRYNSYYAGFGTYQSAENTGQLVLSACCNDIYSICSFEFKLLLQCTWKV